MSRKLLVLQEIETLQELRKELIRQNGLLEQLMSGLNTPLDRYVKYMDLYIENEEKIVKNLDKILSYIK